MMTIWTVLGIEPTDNEGLIRKAYAAKLKKLKQKESVADFQELRESYDAALAYAYEQANPVQENYEPPPSEPNLDVDDESFANQAAEEVEADHSKPETFPQLVEEEFRGYMDQIHKNLGAGDEASAINFVKSILEKPSVANLAYRPILEGWLIQLSASMENFPYEFFNYLVQSFRWKEDSRHLDHQLEDQLNYALGKHEAYARFQELKQEGSTGNNSRRYAAFILTGPFRPIYFRFRRLDKTTVNEVKSLLTELDFHYPVILEDFLDQKTVAWWRNSLQYNSIHWSHLFGSTVVGFMVIVILLGSGKTDHRLQGFIENHALLSIFIVIISILAAKSGADYFTFRYRDFRSRVLAGINDGWKIRGAVLLVGLIPAGIIALGWTPATLISMALSIVLALWFFRNDKAFWILWGTILAYTAANRAIFNAQISFAFYPVFYLMIQLTAVALLSSARKGDSK